MNSNMIKVSEIFSNTIQGEGPHSGLRSCFVRVAGCSFACSWCDSSWTWSDKSAKSYTGEELAHKIIAICTSSHTTNVVLTGGQPCLYDFSEVIDLLHKNNYTVDIETQGDLFPEWLSKIDLITFSPKGPSSLMPDVYEDLKDFLSSYDGVACVKIPIFGEDDFTYALKYYHLVTKLRTEGKNVDLYLSVGNSDVTESGSIQERILSSYEVLIDMVNKSEMERVFILPQIHTLVWGNRRGV